MLAEETHAPHDTVNEPCEGGIRKKQARRES
jgi:hypothetical protein